MLPLVRYDMYVPYIYFVTLVLFPPMFREQVAVTKDREAAGSFISFSFSASRTRAVRLLVIDPSFHLFLLQVLSLSPLTRFSTC